MLRCFVTRVSLWWDVHWGRGILLKLAFIKIVFDVETLVGKEVSKPPLVSHIIVEINWRIFMLLINTKIIISLEIKLRS